MAAQQLAIKLQEDLTCSICMDILRNPVTIDCGHNFCLECITLAGKASENLPCPLCQLSVSKNRFRSNKALASLVETLRATPPAEMQLEREEPRCRKHKEKFHYFCEQDGEFLCVVCRDSKAHKPHSVTLIDEAAQSYTVQIESQAMDLEQKDRQIIEEKKQGEGAIRVFRAQMHLEKIKIHEEFKHLNQRLEEEERFLLSRLCWLEQEGAKQIEHYGTNIEGQLTSLRGLTKSLKNRLQMPSMELLENIKDALSRTEKFQFVNPTPVPVDLKKKFSEAKARHESITENLKELKDNLQAQGKKDKRMFLDSLNKKDMESWGWLQKNKSELPIPVPVTLDMASADPDLTFTQDLKKVTLYLVRRGTSNKQAKPRPFYPFHCVRGSPGLSSGFRVWEAEIQGPSSLTCMVGAATEQASGAQTQNSGSCLWALRISSSGCQPFTNYSAQANLPVSLKKVGVCVNHDCGEVVFYDATTNKHIYTFQTSFAGQVFPLFGLLVAGSHITLSP